MKTTRHAGMAQSRLTLVLITACVALLLVVGALLAGCNDDDIQGLPFFTSGVTKAAEQREAGQVVDKIEAREAGDDTVMKSEDNGSDPLAGDWSFTGMNYTPASKEWGKGKLWPDTEPATVTFVKQGEVYSLARDTVDTVTFDGQNVTIEGTSDSGFHSKYSGVLDGDTITGTRHHSVAALVYDGPWTATRVK